jgi:hypothetical protein
MNATVGSSTQCAPLILSFVMDWRSQAAMELYRFPDLRAE